MVSLYPHGSQGKKAEKGGKKEADQGQKDGQETCKKRTKKAKTKLAKGKLVSRRVRPKKAPSTSVVASDPLMAAYMKEVNRHELLTKEEERELAEKVFLNQDRDAFQELVTKNLRFVVKIAYEYVHYRLKLLDLIQEGNMGLVRAVKEFNPYKDVRLTTYAVWWIRSYIQDAILKNYSLVKIGTTRAQRKLFYRLRAEQRKLEKEGLIPHREVKLLASRLDVKEKDIVEMDGRLGGGDLSLNAPVGGEDGEKTHLQLLEDSSEGADDLVADAEQQNLFKELLTDFGKGLEGREKTFFDERLVSEKPRTLQDLGNQFGVSKERARQIEEQIKKKIKAYVQEKYPDYDLS